MDFIMPFILAPLTISFFWALIDPRSFGKFIGTLFLKGTKGGQAKETTGLKILGQLIFGGIVTAIFFQIHPATIFPIGFFWIQWIRKMNKTSEAAHPEEREILDRAPGTTVATTQFDPFGWKRRKKTTLDKAVYLLVIAMTVTVIAFLVIEVSRSIH